ncbi:MAG: hypothetical protein Q7S60_02805 [bacterium]|nr:hypothetical protein [bacterium]
MDRLSLAWKIAKKPTIIAIVIEVVREILFSPFSAVGPYLVIVILLLPIYIGFIGYKKSNLVTTLLASIMFSMGEAFALVLMGLVPGSSGLGLLGVLGLFLLPLLFIVPMAVGFIIAFLLKRF